MGFADALSISSVAAQLGMPILLTEQNDLTNVTKQYINGKPIDATSVSYTHLDVYKRQVEGFGK